MNEIEYHIAYSHRRGVGRTAVTRHAPITGPAELVAIELELQRIYGITDVVVTSWQRFETNGGAL